MCYMKLLFKLVVVIALGVGAYLYLKPGASLSDFQVMFSDLVAKFSGQSIDTTANTPPVATQAPAAQVNSTPAPKPLETIRLKSGKTVVGNVVIRDAELTMVRTADGKSVQIPTKDIVVSTP